MTASKAEFVYVTYISSTPEKVYDALLDPEMTKLFWGRARNASDWKVGSSWSHGNYDDATEVDVVGKVVEVDRPRRLVLTWASARAGNTEKESRVTFDVEGFMGSVKLTVTHDELELGSKTHEGVSQGWPAILSSLKTLLESGQPMPMTTRRWAAPPPK